MKSEVTASQLYEFVLENAEEVDGHRRCRASLYQCLKNRGIEHPKNLRTELVKELERAGLVQRENPRSRRLLILGD